MSPPATTTLSGGLAVSEGKCWHKNWFTRPTHLEAHQEREAEELRDLLSLWRRVGLDPSSVGVPVNLTLQLTRRRPISNTRRNVLVLLPDSSEYTAQKPNIEAIDWKVNALAQ